MPSDLASLLEDAVGAPHQRPDFGELASRGRRRRRRRQLAQVGAGLISAAVLAAVGLPLARPQTTQVFLDRPLRPGAGSWELVPDAPLAPGDGALALDLRDGTVLVVAGEIEAGWGQAARYDIAQRAWSRLPPVPLSLEGGGDASGGFVQGAATAGGAIVWSHHVLGEHAFEAALLDRESGTWTATGPAPLSPRFQPIVAWAGGRLIVWGGYTGGPDAADPTDLRAMNDDVQDGLADGAVWSPGEGWSPMAEFPLAARHGASMLVADGRVVVWGGAQGGLDDQDRALFADGAVYDVASDRWRVLPEVALSPRWQASITADGDGFILSHGLGAVTITELTLPEGRCSPEPCGTVDSYGREYSYEEPTDAARYDWGTDRWTVLEDPPVDGHDWAELPGGTGTWPVALGELTAAITAPSPFESLPLGGLVRRDGGSWEPIAEAETPARHDAALTALGDEAVFVWGGTSVVPGKDPRHGDPRAFRKHADGAIWRP